MEATCPTGFEPLPLGRGFSNTLGQVLVDREGGRIAFQVLASHCNEFGTCHGGALAVFADLQLAALRLDLVNGGPHRPTINLSLQYFAPVQAGCWIVAHVSLLKETRTMIFTQAVMMKGDVTVAGSSAIYRNIIDKDMIP